MRVRPRSPSAVVDHVVERAVSMSGSGRLRVAVDGPAPSLPDELADSLVAPLRAAGRPVVRVSAVDFLRPASLRWEHGRDDPDALYEDWLDTDALNREVLLPLGPQGSGRYLPSLWDVGRDRATRAAYEQAPPATVLVLDGALLLGRGLELDLTVHLSLRPDTLARRTPEQDGWTLPAFGRYRDEVDPERVADLVVRVDDPRHPAVVERGAGR
ncbi:uridine kinase [Actinotalea sp. K2]|uniref:uridine kinase n=1 Tax=Actinotalea sp. K2 TaxID=2939438 RepID=UPI00201785FA|nr:uridine kinase [Actinotalea sp. K2]MCL3861838.1 uridine kinase [Actinotalea sp. K2]